MNLGFADALRRRPEPAWPLAEALRSLALASPVFATLLSTSLSIASFNPRSLLLLLLLLRGLCLLRFLRHVALQAMMSGDVGTMHIRIDVHRTPITTAPNEKLRISLTKSERRRRVRAALLDR